MSTATYGPVLRANLGRCYELSAKRVGWGQGSSLVHGSIKGFGAPRLDHAWVIEPSGDMWEPVTETVYSPEDFDAMFDPKVEVTYSAQETLQMMMENKHFGPW